MQARLLALAIWALAPSTVHAQADASRSTFHERLVDPAGPVPGLPGFSLTRKASKHHCGGVAIVTTRANSVAAHDLPLAELYALEFPHGLGFSHTDKRQNDAAVRELATFIEDMRRASDKAIRHYRVALAARGQHPAASLEAAAHIALVPMRFASMLGRAEIPLEIRTGPHAAEQIGAYCDALATAALPLLEQAEEALRDCSARAANRPEGWWTPLCPSAAGGATP